MEDKKPIEVDVNKIVLDVYNQIAEWHNDDYDTPKQKGDMLKLVSQSIVKDVLENVFKSIGNTSYVVSRGDKVIAKEGNVELEKVATEKPKDTFDRLFTPKKD